MTNENLNKVAVLLVVTNEEKYIPLFCTSLMSQTYENFSLFVLDNNCSDNSINLIKKYVPDSRILSSKENIGFDKGINLLADIAIKEGYKFLFILNPDIELDKNCIHELVNLITTEKNIGAVGPIMFKGGEKRNLMLIQSYGGCANFMTRSYISLHEGKSFINNIFKKIEDVNLISGGVFFIRADIVKNLGLFDDQYFMYGEEIDLSFRIIKSGYKMKITSDAQVWHHHDWSKKNISGYKFMYYYMMRNRVLYFKKFKLYPYLIYDLFKQVVTFPFTLKMFYRIGSLSIAKYYYLGLWRGLLGETGRSKIQFK